MHRRSLLGLALLAAMASAGWGQDAKPKLTVRDVNVYVMSAYGNSLNHRDLFKSTLPGFAAPNRTTADRKHLNGPSPNGLITFEGEPSNDVDVLIEFDNGRFFAAWPPATQRSKRLLWAHAKLSKEAGAPPALPDGHWMTHLRSADRLWLEAGRRSDRFLVYDAELPLAPPIKVASAEGGYGLTNLGRFPLHDVAVYRPDAAGWMVASLETLASTAKKEEKAPDDAAAKPSPEAVFDDKSPPGATAPSAPVPPAADAAPAPSADAKVKAAAVAVEVAVVAANGAVVTTTTSPGAPLPPDANPAAPPANPPVDEKVITVKAGGEPQSRESIVAAWRKRLTELGLGDPEAEHLVRILDGQALRTDSATIVFRLNDEQLDSMLPIEITPQPDRQVRVALVVLLDADPDLMNRVEELVKKLGDPSYSEREAAEKRLRELGPAARPKLQEAVNNSDPEISFRAEEIVESFDNPIAP